MATSEIVARSFHTCGNVIGLIGNGLLLYLVLMKTPKPIRTYSILMFNFGLTDFLGCLTALLVQQRLIPMGKSLMYISNGPCKHLGPTACYVTYSLMLHCYSHSLWSLLLSFLYRYYVLQSQNLSGRRLLLILLSFYSISLFQFIMFSFASDDPGLVKDLLHERFPLYNLENHAVSANLNIFEWKTLFTIMHMTLPVTPVHCVIIYIRKKIVTKISGNELSDNTKSMHSQLINALTFQALLPAFFFIAAITYLLGQTGILNHPVLEYSSFILVGTLPVLSPIGTISFVRPYHSWIKKKVNRKTVSVSFKNNFTS